MSTALLPKLIEGIVTLSSGVAFDSATKLVTPTRVNAFAGFAIKGASLFFGGLVSTLIAKAAVDSTNSIIETVKGDTPAIEPVKSDS